MADITASLGLKVTADTTDVVKSFTAAERAGAKIGDTVEKKVGEGLKKSVVEAGRLHSAIEKASAVFTALGKSAVLFNQSAEAFNKVAGYAKAAIDLAKFSGEMQRLEKAIPAERMRKLQEETKGTVSRMDLLTRAAKEMGLAATAGMDETTLALRQSLVEWENFFDKAKAAIGGFIGRAIVEIDRLSDRLAGVDHRLQTGASRSQNSQANAEKFADIVSLRKAGLSDAADMRERDEDISGKAWIKRDSPAWRAEYQRQLVLIENRKQRDVHAQILRDAQDANSRGLGGIGLPDWGAAVSGKEKPGLGIFGRQRGGGGETGKPRSAFDLRFQSELSGLGRPTFADRLGAQADALGSLQTGNDNQSGFGAIGPDRGLGALGEAALGGGSSGGLDALKKQQDDLQRMTDVVKGTFDVFGSAIGAAAAAAITGSEGAAAAARKALKIKLQAIATESLVMAAYEGAMALGSLAIGNGASAAAHGASAAKFLVTAGLAGVGAAAVGGGGSSSGQGSASSAPGGGFAMSGGPMSGGVREQTINVNMFGSMTAGNWRDLSRQIRRGLAEGEAAGLGSAGNDNITGRVE